MKFQLKQGLQLALAVFGFAPLLTYSAAGIHGSNLITIDGDDDTIRKQTSYLNPYSDGTTSIVSPDTLDRVERSSNAEISNGASRTGELFIDGATLGASSSITANDSGGFYPTSGFLTSTAHAKLAQLYQVTAAGEINIDWQFDGVSSVDTALIGNNLFDACSVYDFQISAHSVTGQDSLESADFLPSDYSAQSFYHLTDTLATQLNDFDPTTGTVNVSDSGSISLIVPDSLIGKYFQIIMLMEAKSQLAYGGASENDVFTTPNATLVSTDFLNTGSYSVSGAARMVALGETLTGEISSVPLPPALWLMLGGLGLIAGRKNMQRN